MPELAPVTIAFWALSNLRFSVLGTTGFGRSPKVCACGIFGFGRLIASGGMVGIVIPFVVLQIRRADERFLTKRCRSPDVSHRLISVPSHAIRTATCNPVCSRFAIQGCDVAQTPTGSLEITG